MRDAEKMSADLLGWYDIHARDLPWRTGPQQRAAGVQPDPYAVWLSEVMLQQTGVATVKGYFTRFMALWPDVQALADAEDAQVLGEWAGLGYYARARNLIRCARVVAGDLGGAFPGTLAGLRALPGIGPYTAAAIAAIAFDRPETVVDGNVERVMARVHLVTTPLPAGKPQLRQKASDMTPQRRPGDYAQAVMDLGATLCTPRSPACGLCPWRTDCRARAEGLTAELPRRAPKPAKPVRHGIAYVGQREDGAWLVETRPESGLLGGMLGWPGGRWGEVAEDLPPAAGNWRELGEEVRHTFTHFHLRLAVRTAVLPAGCLPERGEFVETLRPTELPSVMRKAYDLARSANDVLPRGPH